MTVWTRWVRHPQNLWLRKALFQIHLWTGIGVGIYIVLISLSGSVLVYRNELYNYISPPESGGSLPAGFRATAWLLDFHDNLLSAETGRRTNGLGAFMLVLLCLTGAVIWRPGVRSWRRSLTIELRSNWKRLTWTIHSALGFWFFAFILMWGITGVYLSLPQEFGAMFDACSRSTRPILSNGRWT